MNITTSLPVINLNTANVHTEAARSDNQKKEVIPPTKQLEQSAAEPKLAGDSDKSKQPGQSVNINQEILSQSQQDEQKIEEKQKEEKNSREEEEPQQNAKDSDSKEEEQQKSKEQQVEQELEQKELAQLNQLKSRDLEVRAHEQAHASIGGQYAGTPKYEFEQGPDGTSYAVSGEVPIDVSEVSGDPRATIDKMQQVLAAALAPAEPSGADRAIAAEAAQKLATAQADLIKENSTFNKAENKSEIEDDEEQDTTQEAGDKEVDSQKDESTVKSRSAEIDERAARIAQFYQQSTSPFSPANFAGQV